MGTTTANLGLYKPDVDETAWGDLRTANEDTVDTSLGTQHNAAGNHIFVEVEDITGYVKFPELTTTERNALPAAAGFTIYNTTDNELQTFQAGSWEAMVGGATTFTDDVFRINDDGDVTKQIAFQASGITTGTARTITMPDNDVDLANLTHTGEVTGTGTLSLDSTAITNQSAGTVASGDTLVISDLDDSGNLKEVTAQSIADLGGGGGVSAHRESFVNAGLTAGVLTVTHSLGEQYVVVSVYNNNDDLVIPDDVTLTDSNNLDVDLSGFGALTGTWNLVVIG